MGKKSLEKVLSRNSKFWDLLWTIDYYENEGKPLRFKHLRYLFCENHGLTIDSALERKIDDHLKSNRYDEILKEFEDDYKNKKITKEEYDVLLENWSNAGLKRRNHIDEKFSNFQRLWEAVHRLIDLSLICVKEKKSRNNGYVLTAFGNYHFHRLRLMNDINRMFPSDIEQAKIYHGVSKNKELLEVIDKFSSRMYPNDVIPR